MQEVFMVTYECAGGFIGCHELETIVLGLPWRRV